jgi:hypothetical protein
MPSTAGAGRAFRDRPLGRVAILALVLVVALLVARTCGSSEGDVSQDEAVEIAKGQIDFEPTSYQIRNVPSGLNQTRIWAVSLYTGTVSNPEQCRVVQVDADSGDVVAVAEC